MLIVDIGLSTSQFVMSLTLTEDINFSYLSVICLPGYHHHLTLIHFIASVMLFYLFSQDQWWWKIEYANFLNEHDIIFESIKYLLKIEGLVKFLHIAFSIKKGLCIAFFS